MSAFRRPWLLLSGLLLGLALGMLYARVVNPVRYQNAAPTALQAVDKDQYRSLAAAAYAATGDLRRAEARLAQLGEPDPARRLAAQAQRVLAQDGPTQEARHLAQLAAALGNRPGRSGP